MNARWDDTWMAIADATAKRSSCHRDQVGAVIVSATQRIIAIGYNGPPAELPKAADFTWSCGGCPRNTFGPPNMCISIHAEANALLFCDRREREGGTIYVTSTPCIQCALLMANSGCHRVVARWDFHKHAYRDPKKAVWLLQQTGLDVVEWGWDE